jgi:hypothetical protein
MRRLRDYPVASYAWDFGDGHTQTGTDAVVTHTYASPGAYTATLGEVDQAGCSTALVFTGQTASCNGSAKAHAMQTITVMSPILAPVVPPTLVPPIAVVSKLKVSPSAVASVRNGKRRAGADVSYTLNVAASVRFTVQRRSTGRRVKHGKKITCDRATKRNRTKTSCVRYTTLTGSFTRAGQAGPNRFRFTGRLNANAWPGAVTGSSHCPRPTVRAVRRPSSRSAR